MATETPRALRAWADYLALGPGRTLESLLNLYQTLPKPPTKQLTTLKVWSSSHDWQARLVLIAAEEVAAAAEREAAYRRQILEEGYAQPHKRIEALKALAGALFEELTRETERRLWVKDVKQIGQGDAAERVDIERFNAAEVEQFRGALDDIAKETGGRVNKTELTGANGEPFARIYIRDADSTH